MHRVHSNYLLTDLEDGWDVHVAPEDREAVREVCLLLMQWVYFRQPGAPALIPDADDSDLIRIIEPEAVGDGATPTYYTVYYKYPRGLLFAYHRQTALIKKLAHRIRLDGLEVAFDATDHRPYVSVRVHTARHLVDSHIDVTLVHRPVGAAATAATTAVAAPATSATSAATSSSNSAARRTITTYPVVDLERGWDAEVAADDRDALKLLCMLLTRWACTRQASAPALVADNNNELVRVIQPDPSGAFYTVYYKYPRGVLFTYHQQAALVAVLWARVPLEHLEIAFDALDDRPYVSVRVLTLRHMARRAEHLEMVLTHRVMHLVPETLGTLREGVLVNRVRDGTVISNTSSPRNKHRAAAADGNTRAAKRPRTDGEDDGKRDPTVPADSFFRDRLF